MSPHAEAGLAVIHYNAWFSFKDGTSEPDGLARVRAFLDELKQRGRILAFSLLRNRGEAGRTRLPQFQALIAFRDDEQFALPFREIAAAGVHAGQHGFMIESVDGLVVEVFEELPRG